MPRTFAAKLIINQIKEGRLIYMEKIS